MKKRSGNNSLVKYTLTCVLVILLIGLALQSCKPEEDPPQQDLGFFPLGEVKDYLYFKPNSWWIYRNSLNGNLDTQVMDWILLDTFSQSSSLRKYTLEDLQFSKYSVTTKWIYDNYKSGTVPDAINWNWSYHLRTNKHGNGFGGEIETFFYPFKRNDGKTNYSISFQDTLKTFTLLGNTYKDVAVFFVYHDDIEDYPLKGQSAKYYWAKGVGLVYHEIRNFNDTSKILKKDELIKSYIYK